MDKSVTNNAAAKRGSLSNAAIAERSEALPPLLADAFVSTALKLKDLQQRSQL
jgi:hypothetical protein